MLQDIARFCPCGCTNSYIIQVEGDTAPVDGEILHYVCPHSRETLSFRSHGLWKATNDQFGHRTITASRGNWPQAV